MDISSLLSRALAASKTSKAMLARKMGVSRAYITQLLHPNANPSWRTIQEVLAICGRTLSLKLENAGTRKPSVPVPPELHYLFWDADLKKLDVYLHKSYIFKRILNSNDTRAWKWLFRNFSKKQVIRFIENSHGKLDPRSLNYWALILGKEREWQKLPQKTPFKSWRNLAAAG